MQTANERARQAVRQALLTFGSGETAAWLGNRNRVLDGRPPINAAKASSTGLMTVLRLLDFIAAAQDN